MIQLRSHKLRNP